MKNKYLVYAIASATKTIGAYEAESAEDAVEMALSDDECEITSAYVISVVITLILLMLMIGKQRKSSEIHRSKGLRTGGPGTKGPNVETLHPRQEPKGHD